MNLRNDHDRLNTPFKKNYTHLCIHLLVIRTMNLIFSGCSQLAVNMKLAFYFKLYCNDDVNTHISARRKLTHICKTKLPRTYICLTDIYLQHYQFWNFLHLIDVFMKCMSSWIHAFYASDLCKVSIKLIIQLLL